MASVPRTALSFSGLEARIVPSAFGSGVILEIGGGAASAPWAEQSHVDIDDPFEIRYEYLRRIAHVLDSAWDELAPISALHLGAGALTLVRYLQATRPGSAQVAVDIEPEIMPFVREHLPLPPGTRLETLVGDARAAVEAYAAAAGARDAARGSRRGPAEAESIGAPGKGGAAGAPFDAIVLDVFAGRDTAPHLATHEFYASALGALSPRGVLLVNVGGDEGQRFLAAQARELATACRDTPPPGGASGGATSNASGEATSGLDDPWILTDTLVARDRREGNAILVAGPGMGESRLEGLREHWLRLGPHPAAVGPWRDIVGA